MNVILPEATRAQPEKKTAKKHPTLWLLHGMSDDHTIWLRRTSIERYAVTAGLAVVMPEVGLSWYQDMAAGPAYGKFLREELPVIAQSMFPLSPFRKDNFVAGLSMGGYGAFLLGLSQPERFAAAASLSGALDMASYVHKGDAPRKAVYRAAFGPAAKVRGSAADVFHLARSCGPKPALYACCGTKDPLLEQNRDFAAQAEKIKLPVTYEEHEGEGHEWGYWDRQIKRVIDWLPR